MKKLPLRIVGVMTGTSCDGLDAACLEVSTEGWSPIWEKSIAYPQTLRKRILKFQIPGELHSSKNWLELHRDLGDWYGHELKRILKSQKFQAEVIANHGQTVAHFPNSPRGGVTLQLGDGTRIATATGLTVITKFRDGDMAAGGQGAPLAPLFHQMLAQHIVGHSQGIAIHNLGGISNLTYLCSNGKVIAFDTGPGNIWIDAAVEKVTRGKSTIDWNGQRSSEGDMDKTAVQKILKHPYFSKAAPKSTGRDEFPVNYFFSRTRAQGASLVATAAEITIETIAQAYEKWILSKKLPLKMILLCGGGAKNLTIQKGLARRLAPIKISTLQEWGLDSQFIEAQAFAVYGFLSLLGHPLGGTWTGVKTFGPPGHLIPGANWQNVLGKVYAFLKS